MPAPCRATLRPAGRPGRDSGGRVSATEHRAESGGDALAGMSAAALVVPARTLGSPATEAATEAGAEAADRHLGHLASDGVAYLMYWLVTLLLVSQAFTSVMGPPRGSLAIGLLAGLICLIWAVFCLAMGVLRGTDPGGGDRPVPAWLPVIASLGCMVSLSIVRFGTDQPGEPWPSELVVAGLVVAAITVWLGTAAGAVAGIAMAALILAAPLLQPSHALLLHTPLSDLVTGTTMVVIGFSAALGLGWLRRSALQLQRSLEARDELLVREQAVRSAAEVAAEVERSLHDTALNTLETIAAHGEHLPAEAVVARCRSDVAQLSGWRSEAGMTDLAEVLDRLAAHAERLGLSLDVQVVASGADEPGAVPVPPPVLQAFCGAASEALTNVAKHAGVGEATVLVVHDVSTLQLLVADEGVGPGAADGGFGLRGSVEERMAAVGGRALVSSGPREVGTAVALGWQPAPPEPPHLATDLLIRVAAAGVGIATTLAGVGCALVVLGWPAYAHPWPALIAPMVCVLVAAWLLGEVRRSEAGPPGGDAGRPRGSRIGAWHVLATCAAYVLVGALSLFADPYCSSLLGERVVMDARAPMVVVLLLLAPRPGVLASLLATVTAAHLLGALKWNALSQACGATTTTSGVYLVAALGAVWLFARRLARLSEEYAQARAQTTEAEIRIRAQLSVRTEGEIWVADTLASAQELLGDIAAGLRSPSDPATREECAAEARFLRSLLAVGRAPEGLRRPARIWLRLLRAARCTVVIRGAFPSLPPPPVAVGQIGGVLDLVASMAPGSTVTLAVWSDPETDSMMLTVAGPAVARCLERLAGRAQAIAPDAWSDRGEDSLTVEWIWSRQSAVPAPTRATVAS